MTESSFDNEIQYINTVYLCSTKHRLLTNTKWIQLRRQMSKRGEFLYNTKKKKIFQSIKDMLRRTEWQHHRRDKDEEEEE